MSSWLTPHTYLRDGSHPSRMFALEVGGPAQRCPHHHHPLRSVAALFDTPEATLIFLTDLPMHCCLVPGLNAPLVIPTQVDNLLLNMLRDVLEAREE